SRFGLQAGVYTQNLNKMLYAWDHLHVGGVIINDIPSFRVDNMPYGGVKDSGLGREGIQSAIRDMQEERMLVIKSYVNDINRSDPVMDLLQVRPGYCSPFLDVKNARGAGRSDLCSAHFSYRVAHIAISL